MTLDQYLWQHDLTSRQFAEKVKVSIHAVRKWRQGQSIPRSEMLLKIKKQTKNAVKPEDWYKG